MVEEGIERLKELNMLQWTDLVRSEILPEDYVPWRAKKTHYSPKPSGMYW